MKIVLATGIYPPEIGGPATYARILEEEMPRRGIEVTVYPFRAVRHLPRIVRHVAYFLIGVLLMGLLINYLPHAEDEDIERAQATVSMLG